MIISKHEKHICFTRILKWFPIFFLAFVVGLSPLSADALEILLGTGEKGTFSHFTGRTLCRIIDRHTDDIDCKTVPASDGMHNLTNLRDGSLDVILVDSRMLYDAKNRSGYFKFMDINYDNLRTLTPLYATPVTLVVRSDAGINSLAELNGKRINAGAPRSLQRLAVDTIVTAKNWSRSDFSLVAELSASQAQDTLAFCHGTVQAMVHIGVHPDSSLQQLMRLCEVDFVDMNDSDIEKLVNGNPAFSMIDIAADTYPALPEAVKTFGTRTILVASEGLDEQTVYTIIEAIFSNRKRLENAHPALSPTRVDKAYKLETGVEPHPGAVRYFSETQ